MNSRRLQTPVARPRSAPRRSSDPDPFRLAIVALVIAGTALSCWAVGGIAAVLGGHGWRDIAPSGSLRILIRVLAHPRSPASAWPPRLRGDLPGPVAFWSLLCAVVASGVAIRQGALRLAEGRKPKHSPAQFDVGWATPNDLKPLTPRSRYGGRLVVGRFGRRFVAVERSQSVLVVGPTQSGKTSGIAIPAILEWDGPIVATSVKTDLVEATSVWRERRGRVFVFDPVGVSDSPRASWSPLLEATTWIGAKRAAAGLCSVQRDAGRSPEDAAFWGALAQKLLAPMLLAASSTGATMQDVVSWVDTGAAGTVLDALEGIGAKEALEAAQASFSREERQLSSVYATAEAAVAAFGDETDGGPEDVKVIDVPGLFSGGSDTLYLVAPSHDQERLRPAFVALLRCVLEEGFTRATRHGKLDPPLLVVLDEAANIAPPSNLDALASTAASHGIQLVTVFQDFAQIEARYGQRAATVVNNHRAKLICSGIADPATLDHISRLIGDARHGVESVTVDMHGVTSTTFGEGGDRRLAPASSIRRLDPGEAILLYGHLPPARVSLRNAYRDRDLRRISRPAANTNRRGSRHSASFVNALVNWRGRWSQRV